MTLKHAWADLEEEKLASIPDDDVIAMYKQSLVAVEYLRDRCPTFTLAFRQAVQDHERLKRYMLDNWLLARNGKFVERDVG